MSWDEHYRNRSEFPYEELLKYEGQQVAWSLDGKRILAGHEDPLQLVAGLTAAGYKSDEYVLSFVDFDTHLGGALLNEWSEGDRDVVLTPNRSFAGQRT
jgi:hypothetical protein